MDGWHAQVLTHERRGPDVAVFTCRAGVPLPYHPGQYVTIECPYRPWQSRAYAIANAPRRDQVLEFHVRAGGPAGVSSALVHRLKIGDMLRLSEAHGTLALDPFSRRDVVFVTGGTGLAPAKALIEELARVNRTRWIHLFRGERRRADFYDRVSVDQLSQRHPWLTVIRATSEEPDENGEQVTVADLVAREGPWPDHDFYVFGSAPMVESTLRRLDQMGVTDDRIRHGAYDFNPAVRPAWSP
ncbi:FAD-binding oxidoreductase [Actinoplanes sp. NPDC026619]|uniref:FAD-binding oxidoreductase n=1 Tax=Actinoplanes sp. NPDC026619 TaxID=3155798 RepID=UPI0033CB3D54